MPFKTNITDLVTDNVKYAGLAISLLGYYLHPDYAGNKVPEGNIARWAESSELSTIQAFPQMFVNDYFELTEPLGMALATEMISPLGVTPQERMGAVLAFVSVYSQQSRNQNNHNLALKGLGELGFDTKDVYRPNLNYNQFTLKTWRSHAESLSNYVANVIGTVNPKRAISESDIMRGTQGIVAAELMAARKLGTFSQLFGLNCLYGRTPIPHSEAINRLPDHNRILVESLSGWMPGIVTLGPFTLPVVEVAWRIMTGDPGKVQEFVALISSGVRGLNQ